MNLFKHNSSAKKATENQAAMAEMALKVIHDGVIITDKKGIIKFINPAAATMTGYGLPDRALGLDYGLVLKIQSKEGRELPESENPLTQAMQTGQTLDVFQCSIVIGQSAKTIPVAICMIPTDGLSQDRIISFRDITKELEEEGEQTEFISTASHEMRTPVATIDGYLSLSLNPQTATIDERARNYLTAAQKASKHLGKLFRDLLDVTKLDDGRIRAHFEPVEMVSLVEEITNEFVTRAKEGKIDLKFGSSSPQSFGGESRRLGQVAYSFVDVDFVREILENLIDNAIKYTPNGGSIYVNVRGDGDRILINVTDTGMGISSDDLSHIFQKFYRADNSDTRTIGGTGLGLYLVKQRVEAMGGKVWAESAFGEGSTFYVSLPRLTHAEYEKRMIIVRNQQAQAQVQAKAQASTGPQLPAGLTPSPKDFMHETPPATPDAGKDTTITPPTSPAPQSPTPSSSLAPQSPTIVPSSVTPVAPQVAPIQPAGSLPQDASAQSAVSTTLQNPSIQLDTPIAQQETPAQPATITTSHETLAQPSTSTAPQDTPAQSSAPTSQPSIILPQSNTIMPQTSDDTTTESTATDTSQETALAHTTKLTIPVPPQTASALTSQIDAPSSTNQTDASSPITQADASSPSLSSSPALSPTPPLATSGPQPSANQPTTPTPQSPTTQPITQTSLPTAQATSPVANSQAGASIPSTPIPQTGAPASPMVASQANIPKPSSSTSQALSSESQLPKPQTAISSTPPSALPAPPTLEPNQLPTVNLPPAPPIPPTPSAPPVLKSDETIVQKQIDINLNGESK